MDKTIHTENQHSHVASKKLRNVVTSCMIGNALEWYDFALYGYFATIIGKLIFPPDQSPVALLLKSYAVFFLGFIMRPLGAIVFGYIGDKHGRKKALMWSIYCMAIPTTLIGLLPTYHQVGAWSAILLSILRLFQGLSMGGEFTGSMIFVVENAPEGKKGFWGSWSSLSVLIGLLLGSIFGMLISTLMSVDQLESWGWRLPFLLSFGGSWVGSNLRKSIDESPVAPSDIDYRKQKNTALNIPPENSLREKSPLQSKALPKIYSVQTLLTGTDPSQIPDSEEIELPEIYATTKNSSKYDISTSTTKVQSKKVDPVAVHRVPMLLSQLFSQYWRDMIRVVLIDVVIAVGFFLVCIYVMTYIQNFSGVSYRFAVMTNTFSMLAFAAAIPLSGILADRWGCVAVMQRFILILSLISVPCFWGLCSGSSWMIIFSHVLLSIVMGCIFAPVPALMVSIFPSYVRYSGVSIAHNISMAIFGGSAPQIATYWIDCTQNKLMPGIFLMLTALLSWSGLQSLKQARVQKRTKIYL